MCAELRRPHEVEFAIELMRRCTALDDQRTFREEHELDRCMSVRCDPAFMNLTSGQRSKVTQLAARTGFFRQCRTGTSLFATRMSTLVLS